MSRPPSQTRLADYERRYRQLAHKLADIGWIASGSVIRRYTRCASPGCRCNADPPQPHGPYWQWSAKIDGKTRTRRLTEREARLYQQAIANDRELRATIAKMRDIAAKAIQLQLNESEDA